MGSPLLCSRCGREIMPGDRVTFPDLDVEHARIVVEPVAVEHETCPEPDDEAG